MRDVNRRGIDFLRGSLGRHPGRIQRTYARATAESEEFCVALKGRMPNAPDAISIEFVTAQGRPIQLCDLEPDFLRSNGISPQNADRPFRVLAERKTSKAGNAFYDYSQNGVPLPDGLSSSLNVEKVALSFGEIRPSKKGYPTREGSAEIEIGGIPYKVTAYITEAKNPYYIKVHAQKKPESATREPIANSRAPRGGRIV
jgi:hypothetical protein